MVVVIIPGVVVFLIAMAVLMKILGPGYAASMKGPIVWLAGLAVVVGFAAMVWSTIDDEELKRITEFWSDFF